MAMVGTWKTKERSSEVWKPGESQQNVPTDPFPSVHWPLLARSSWRHWPWLRRSQPCQTQCCHHRCSRHRFGNSEKQSARLVLLSLDAETFSRQQEGQQEKQSCRRECSPVGHSLRPFIKLQMDWMDHCNIMETSPKAQLWIPHSSFLVCHTGSPPTPARFVLSVVSSVF